MDTIERHSFDLTDVDISALLEDGILSYSSTDEVIDIDSDTFYGSDEPLSSPKPSETTSSTIDSNEKTTKYLEKLYCLLENCPSSIAAWTSDGKAFMIYDSYSLEKKIMPKYFKPIKFESFARQLNSYGFKKVKTMQNQRIIYEFRHERFVRGQSDQLQTIQRRRRRLHSMSANDMTEMTDVELRLTVSDLMRVVNTLHSDLAETKNMVRSLLDIRSNVLIAQ